MARNSELAIFSQVGQSTEIEGVKWEALYPQEGGLEFSESTLQFDIKPTIGNYKHF